jgi:hypothetical protein
MGSWDVKKTVQWLPFQREHSAVGKKGEVKISEIPGRFSGDGHEPGSERFVKPDGYSSDVHQY